MPDVDYYLQHRNNFIILGYKNEVQRLDLFYSLNFLYNKEKKLIKIIKPK